MWTGARPPPSPSQANADYHFAYGVNSAGPSTAVQPSSLSTLRVPPQTAAASPTDDWFNPDLRKIDEVMNMDVDKEVSAQAQHLRDWQDLNRLSPSAAAEHRLSFTGLSCA